MFFVDGRGQETDRDGQEQTEGKQTHGEVQVVNILDNRWSVVRVSTRAGGFRVGELQNEPYASNHQANCQRPESTLRESIYNVLANTWADPRAFHSKHARTNLWMFQFSIFFFHAEGAFDFLCHFQW